MHSTTRGPQLLRQRPDIPGEAFDLFGSQPAERGHVARPDGDDTSDLLIAQIEMGIGAGVDLGPDATAAVDGVASRTRPLVELRSKKIFICDAATPK